MLKLRLATTTDAQCIAKLANEIWHQHYDSIVGEEQIEYMLKTFQSKSVIEQQIADNSMNYVLFVDENNNACGYAGYKNENNNIVFLSKVYLLSSSRGQGGLRILLEHLSKIDAKQIYLTVNKNNHTAIAAYTKVGFVVVKEQVADIGNGFVMDDYIMQKTQSHAV